MKTLIFIFSIFILFTSCKEKYSNPQFSVDDIRKQMVGKWSLVKLHIIYYNHYDGSIISDSTFNNVCQFELTSENWDGNSADEIFAKIIFPNLLVQKSAIINYLYLAFGPIPQDFSGQSHLFWDPDSYQKRIIIWGIIPSGSLHLTLNREIISKSKEKWWIIKTINNNENNDYAYFFEEWEIEKLK